MTPSAVFSGPLFSPLGWALFHFLWQGALVAGLSAGLGWLVRKRTPALRYALACAALATMFALPVATAWSLAARAEHRAPGGAQPASRREAVSLTGAIDFDAIAGGGAFVPATLRNRIEAVRPWALVVWFAGVLILSVRFIGGLAAAGRLTRRGTRPAPTAWQETLHEIAARLSVTRPVRLLESAVVRVPTAIGILRPVVLFPATVFTGLPTRGLEALIAHELAHVRRHDYLVNLLQTVVETVLFYHPAVWWVSGRVRAEREQCCDDLAIAATGDARSYARALMRLEEMRGSALAVAAGGGNLWKRVVRLLAQSPTTEERPAGWLAGTVALAMLTVLGAAARVGPAAGWNEAGDAGAVSAVTEEPDAVVRPAEEKAEPSPSPLEEMQDPAAIPAAHWDGDDSPDAEEPIPTADAEEPTTAVEAKRVLTPDELVAFRSHGVTGEYVRSIAALGYDRADPDDILSLRIHGVTAADIAGMNRIVGRRSLAEHAAFKIHGVTPETVERLSALGLGKLSDDDVLAMKIHGVDASYVERLRSAGYRNVSAEDAVSAKIHGVGPDDAEAWKQLGYSIVSLEDLVGARIHGASPEFAAGIRALGFSNVSLEDLVAFRIHGVTESFLREMKSLGFAPPLFSTDDALAFRIHGVTLEFVREIRSLGYADASPEDLADLRIHGISSEEIRTHNSRAGRRLPLEKHVERHTWEEEDHDEDES